MNYEEMSDFEINDAITTIVFGCKQWEGHVVRYCNDPAKAWPIIVDNKIAIAPAKATAGMWFGSSADGSLCAPMDSNPLRAAMIVFLMMNEGES